MLQHVFGVLCIMSTLTCFCRHSDTFFAVTSCMWCWHISAKVMGLLCAFIQIDFPDVRYFASLTFVASCHFLRKHCLYFMPWLYAIDCQLKASVHAGVFNIRIQLCLLLELDNILHKFLRRATLTLVFVWLCWF